MMGLCRFGHGLFIMSGQEELKDGSRAPHGFRMAAGRQKECAQGEGRLADA
jgi:hypothetical protein